MLNCCPQYFADADFTNAFFNGERCKTCKANTTNKDGESCKNIREFADKFFGNKLLLKFLVNELVFKRNRRIIWFKNILLPKLLLTLSSQWLNNCILLLLIIYFHMPWEVKHFLVPLLNPIMLAWPPIIYCLYQFLSKILALNWEI